MRANEFINEGQGKIHKDHASVQQGVHKVRDVGGYDRTYHLNRLWMATAMADGKSKKPVKMDASSWVEKYNTAHPYTQEEHNMLHQAMKTVPTDHKEVQPFGKSMEPDDTHKVSPTSNWNSKKKIKESGTSGGTTSGSVASVPGGNQKKGKTKLNLLGFPAEGAEQETKIIKRKP
jgi:hypothetical protein